MTITTLAPPIAQSTSTLAIGDFALATPHAWPGRLAAAIPLERTDAEGRFTWDEIRWVLHARRGLVDAVVFTGAEPAEHTGLVGAMLDAKLLGYEVGLHTTGSHPYLLSAVLPFADWVSLEVSTPRCVTARSSLEIIMRSGVPYEVTLTVDPANHSRQDVFDIVRDVIHSGAHAPVLTGRRLYEVIRLADLPDLERR